MSRKVTKLLVNCESVQFELIRLQSQTGDNTPTGLAKLTGKLVNEWLGLFFTRTNTH